MSRYFVIINNSFVVPTEAGYNADNTEVTPAQVQDYFKNNFSGIKSAIAYTLEEIKTGCADSALAFGRFFNHDELKRLSQQFDESFKQMAACGAEYNKYFQGIENVKKEIIRLQKYAVQLHGKLKQSEQMQTKYTKQMMTNPLYDSQHKDIDQRIKEYTSYMSNNRSKRKGLPIVQLTLDGQYINTWDSITQASIVLRIPDTKIGLAHMGKIPDAGGYKWVKLSDYQRGDK